MHAALELVRNWAERWLRLASSTIVVRTIEVFREHEVRDAQISAAVAALEEARTHLDGAVTHAQLQFLVSSVRTPAAAASPAASRVEQALRRKYARYVLASERSGQRSAALLARLVRSTVEDDERVSADPPLGLETLDVLGAGAEGAVLKCVTRVTGL
jgi:hypothetical protein